MTKPSKEALERAKRCLVRLDISTITSDDELRSLAAEFDTHADAAVAAEREVWLKRVVGTLHEWANWNDDFEYSQYPELAQAADAIAWAIRARAEPKEATDDD